VTTEMDPGFTSALREVLVNQVTASAAVKHRRRYIRGGMGIAAVALVATGTALASGTFDVPPGSDVAVSVAPAVDFTGRGTQEVPIGAPPQGANRIGLQFTCLSAGAFVFPDGASVRCDAADAGQSTTTYNLPISGRSFTISAPGGGRWHLVAQYARVHTTEWGVNDDGQTYGVINDRGTPDLVAVIATNGRSGYVYAAQLRDASDEVRSPAEAISSQAKTTSIPVYEADGQTPVGQFEIRAVEASP
jgi:hypothetical protein